MAPQSFQIDPNPPSGVSQGSFDFHIENEYTPTITSLFQHLIAYNAHVHTYQKVTNLGSDGSDLYSSPTRVPTIDDDEVFSHDGGSTTDMEAVGLTLGAQNTSTPTPG